MLDYNLEFFKTVCTKPDPSADLTEPPVASSLSFSLLLPLGSVGAGDPWPGRWRRGWGGEEEGEASPQECRDPACSSGLMFWVRRLHLGQGDSYMFFLLQFTSA